MVLRHWYVLWNESNYFTNRYTYRYSRFGKLNHSLGIQSISLSIIILKRRTKDKPMKVNLIITHSFIQEKLQLHLRWVYALFIILVSLFSQLVTNHESLLTLPVLTFFSRPLADWWSCGWTTEFYLHTNHY